MPATIAPGGKFRLININGSGGAFTSVFATQLTRRVLVVEDASGNAGTKQGLQIQIANDGSANGFTNTITLAPTDEPFILQEFIPLYTGKGAILGNGPDASGGKTIPATQLFNVRANGAAATVIRVEEDS